MLRFIGQLLWRRRRNIFRYNNGRKICCIDPVVAMFGLHEHKSFLPRHLGEAVDGDPEAMRIVCQAACEVFKVHPLSADGKSGLTASEMIELMIAFDAYLFALKKNIERSQTKPGYMASTSQGLSESITNDMSDCY
jgi:hypothetical protein